VTRPRLLDLFCGAGGAGMGYHLAGFDVVGVDVEPQPRYPFRFVQGDALDVLAGWDLMPPFDAVHASPPCRDHSTLSFIHGKVGTGYLLEATRRALVRTGLPYVIENVPGAPLLDPLWLCGSEFGLLDGGRWLKRHRGFESNVLLMGAGGCNCAGRPIGGVYGGGPQTTGGRFKFDAAGRRRVMGIDWMTRDEMAQAIPPAYTQFIGEQLMDALSPAPCPGGAQ
jgi:DNA (cytosine-5)-methyltransferase 1